MKRPFSQVNVFSSDPLSGNPLAVVHAAEGLSEARMAVLARSSSAWSARTTPASQGAALQRAGRVHVHKDGDAIWLGGEVVDVIRGQIEL